MRIDEIVDFDPRPAVGRKSDYISSINAMKSSRRMDDGVPAFSTVYKIDSPKRLNQVTKLGRTGDPDDPDNLRAQLISGDGYLSYLYAIRDIENPYFPKIYDLKIFKDKNTGKLSFKADIEKYLDFSYHKLAHNHDLMASLLDDMFFSCVYIDENALPIRNIHRCLKSSVYNRAIIKDPDLKDAIGMIYDLSVNNSFEVDLHSGNIMWKITGNRPQLKIVDPLA